MAYTDIDKPTDYFNTKLYSGNGGTQSISSVGFQPNFVWIKNRTSDFGSRLLDSVRGATKELFSNATSLENTNTNSLTSFNSDGFSLGSHGGVNENSSNFVAWNWKTGTSFSNSAGANGSDIASSGSVNTTAGFSIVKWVGNGTDDQKIAHGLSSTVKMILCKRYIGGSPDAWAVYHVGLPVTQYLVLNTTVGGQSDNEVIWSDEHPTSSVFTVGNHGMTNDSGSTMIGYCFSEVKGFSKMGSYTGNGSSDGSYIHLGFKPAFYMIKRTDSSGAWIIKGNLRPGYNVNGSYLVANDNIAESTGSGNVASDELSNGFKIRGPSTSINASGGTYVYYAVAENPFVTSASAIPTTAR